MPIVTAHRACQCLTRLTRPQPRHRKAAKADRDSRHRQRLRPALGRVVEHDRRRVDASDLQRRGGRHLDLAANVLQRCHQSSKRRLTTVAASFIRSGSFWSRKSLNHVTGADTTRCWPPQLRGQVHAQGDRLGIDEIVREVGFLARL